MKLGRVSEWGKQLFRGMVTAIMAGIFGASATWAEPGIPQSKLGICHTGSRRHLKSLKEDMRDILIEMHKSESEKMPVHPISVKLNDIIGKCHRQIKDAEELIRVIHEDKQTLSSRAILGALSDLAAKEDINSENEQAIIKKQKKLLSQAADNNIEVHYLDSKGRSRVVRASAQQLGTVDALARTSAGEMGTSTCKIQDVEAVGRIVYNRTHWSKLNPGSELFVSQLNPNEDEGEIKSFAYHSLTEAATKHSRKTVNNSAVSTSESKGRQYYQFNAWNPKDPNFEKIRCPEEIGPGGLKNERWQQILQVAFEMVFEEKQFLEKTKQVTGHYFTSGKDAYNKFAGTYVPISASISGVPINRMECVQVWDERKMMNQAKQKAR